MILCYLYYGDFMNNSINIKKIIKSILVFSIFWFSFLIQYFIISILHINLKTASKSTLILTSLAADIILLIILTFIYHKDLKKEFKIFKSNLLENLNTGLQCWIIGIIIMITSNLLIQLFLHPGIANNENAVRKMLDILPWAMIINAGIIAPFNEEIAFRKTIKDACPNKYLFIILSFLLFGGAHIIKGATTLTDYLFIIPYGSLGAAFAYAYYKTNTIFTSMSFHMFHNLSLTLILLLL